MTAYQWMLKTNYHLIRGGTFTDEGRNNIARRLMAARTPLAERKRFYLSVRFPNNIDALGKRMYPDYFIPPYNNGKKYPTLFGQVPKTHILSANSYELEIIRLLWLLCPDDPEVRDMTKNTLVRLGSTCFGSEDDGVGECFDTNLVVLRFLAAAAPGETLWMRERIRVFHAHFKEKKRHSALPWYFRLCLSELPIDVARREIERCEGELFTALGQSYSMNSEAEQVLHPVMVCAARNALSRLPKYERLRLREPYVDSMDGRIHFDIN